MIKFNHCIFFLYMIICTTPKAMTGNSNCTIDYRELPDGVRQYGDYSKLAPKLRTQKVIRTE